MSEKATAAKEKKPLIGNEILRLGIILFLVCFVAALLLGGVNALTADRIVAVKAAAVAEAMARVLPDAEFTKLDVQETDFAALSVDATGVVVAAYRGERDGETVGYTIESQPSGFGGAMTLVIGVSTDGTVTGVEISSHGETPGLGAKAEDPLFLARFTGGTAPFTVVKTGGSGENEINAITGATVTSTAVARGVDAAVAFAATLS